MKLIKFAGKPAYLINSEETKEKICSLVKEKVNISLSFKNYNFLNTGNVDLLKKELDKDKDNYLFGHVSFGQKYFILFTNLNKQDTVIFINKKKLDMIAMKLDFDNILFSDTLIDGELFKNNEKWCFQSTDIYLYKNQNILDEELEYRMSKLNKVFKEYYKPNSGDPCKFNVIKYLSLEFLKSVFENPDDTAEYKVSGLSFKHLNENKNYVYIFEKNRKTNKSSNKYDVVLQLRNTELPDVYDIYCRKNKKSSQLISKGIATIPSFELSKKLRLLFSKNDVLLFGCNFVKSFNNFVPNVHLVDEEISTFKEVSHFSK